MILDTISRIDFNNRCDTIEVTSIIFRGMLNVFSPLELDVKIPFFPLGNWASVFFHLRTNELLIHLVRLIF